MSPDIRELRAQRDLVRRHLDWLESRLRDAEGAAAPSPAEESAAPSGLPDSAAEPPRSHTLRSEADTDALLAACANENGGIGFGTKLGCVAAAALAVAIFLAILFVLPRFLYGERGGLSAAPPTTSTPTEEPGFPGK